MSTAPKFSTLAVHAGAAPDPSTGARVTPIYQTTSYVFNDADHAAALFGLEAFGNIYTRITNPTQAVLEGRVAALEGGTAALAVASGHAAQFLVFHTLLEPGDEFVAGRQLYGGSINQFNHSFKKFNWNVVWADADRPRLVREGDHAQDQGDLLRVDRQPRRHRHRPRRDRRDRQEGRHSASSSTTRWPRPTCASPKEFGADIVVHSLTKFMGGHGNSIGGVLVDCGTFDWLGAKHRYKTLVEPNASYNGMKLAETFGNFAFAIAARVMGLRDIGPAIAPMNAFLILTGIETLPLRMQRHCENTLAVGARTCRSTPRSPGSTTPACRRAQTTPCQQKIAPNGAGAVFTFGLKGGYEAGVKLVAGLKLFSHLANIGDTRSLVIHPASTTHRQLTDEQKKAAGAGPDVVRLSIGIEDKADIIADLEQALAAV